MIQLINKYFHQICSFEKKNLLKHIQYFEIILRPTSYWFPHPIHPQAKQCMHKKLIIEFIEIFLFNNPQHCHNFHLLVFNVCAT